MKESDRIELCRFRLPMNVDLFCDLIELTSKRFEKEGFRELYVRGEDDNDGGNHVVMTGLPPDAK